MALKKLDKKPLAAWRHWLERQIEGFGSNLDFAEKVGISEAYVSFIRNGRRDGGNMAIQIMYHLGVFERLQKGEEMRELIAHLKEENKWLRKMMEQQQAEIMDLKKVASGS